MEDGNDDQRQQDKSTHLKAIINILKSSSYFMKMLQFIPTRQEFQRHQETILLTTRAIAINKQQRQQQPVLFLQ